MVISFRVYLAIVTMFGFTAACGSVNAPKIANPNDVENTRAQEASIQKDWLQPDSRIRLSWNVPSLAAGVVAGSSAAFVNWATLRGNLWAMRRDLRKRPTTSVEAFTVKETERLNRYRDFSILRRTTPWRVAVFGLPAYATYHAVATNSEWQAIICGYLQSARDHLK